MRTVFFACVNNSLEAVEFYRKAFNAELTCCYLDSTGKFVEHAELTINSQLFLSLMESSETRTGSTMYFWFTFDDEKSLYEAYKVLKEGAEIRGEPSSCEWCKLITDLTDKYGIRWLLNVF